MTLLLPPPTPSRTLRPIHEARGAALHMLGEVLWHPVQLFVTAPTEVGDPEVLPRVAVGCDRISVHHPTIRAECYLLSLIFAIIEGHP